jgi:hypothetical protein
MPLLLQLRMWMLSRAYQCSLAWVFTVWAKCKYWIPGAVPPLPCISWSRGA